MTTSVLKELFCEICQLQLVNSNHNKKPFKCSKYDSNFKLRKGLNRYNASVHGEKEPMKLCFHNFLLLSGSHQIEIKFFNLTF